MAIICLCPLVYLSIIRLSVHPSNFLLINPCIPPSIYYLDMIYQSLSSSIHLYFHPSSIHLHYILHINTKFHIFIFHVQYSISFTVIIIFVFYSNYFMPSILFCLQLLLSYFYFILIISCPVCVFLHFLFLYCIVEGDSSDCCCNCCAYDNKPS